MTRKRNGLTKELVPLKVPYLVREGWGFIALSIILFFPGVAISFNLLYHFQKVVSYFLGRQWESPGIVPVILVAISVYIFFYGPIWLVFGKASKFVLTSVKHHLYEEKPELAEKLAVVQAYHVWYREYRKNSWFRRFLEEHNLYDQSSRYRKFKRRRERRWTFG